MQKFWNWIRDDAGGRTLRLEGPIDSESFWGDEITPAQFRSDLYAEEGDVTVYINSPGGNVFAAAEIYTMLGEYPGKVTVKIDAIAASAASVIAMAGEEVLMSPVAMIMVHDPSTIAFGNAKDMEKAISTLNEVKESIINAYQAKTGLRRNKIAELMENETWMNAKKAVELGFADGILFEGKDGSKRPEEDPEREDPDSPGSPEEEEDGKKKKEEEGISIRWEAQPSIFSAKAMGMAILNHLGCFRDGSGEGAGVPEEAAEPAEDGLSGDASADGGDGPADGEDGSTDMEDFPTKGETPPVKGAGPAGGTHTSGGGKAADDKPGMPVIGMDGRTKDGAMPYEILKEKLEWLR